MDQARRQLLELLRKKSFRYSPDKLFKLVSAAGRAPTTSIAAPPPTMPRGWPSSGRFSLT